MHGIERRWTAAARAAHGERLRRRVSGSALARWAPARWSLVWSLGLVLAVAACRGEERSALEPGAAAVPASDRAPAAAAGPPWRPGYVRPPIIDIHGHIMPDGLERLARIHADNGIALMNNLSGGSLGRGAETSVAMSNAFPGIVHFYTPDWRNRHAPDFGTREAAGLEEAVRVYGFKGLKIAKVLGLGADLPDGSRMPVDWPGLDPLWAKAGELGVPVAIHTGDPKAFWDPVTPHNERHAELSVHPGWSYHGKPGVPSRAALLAERDRMIAKHRGTTFIGVHLAGNPEDLDAVDRWLREHPNTFVDVAARVPELGRHPPDRVRAFFASHRERILFGTDLGVGSRGLMLGSTGDEVPTMDDVKPFYDAHFRYFEGTEKGIAHPTPIQGDWTIDAVGLDTETLDLFYRGNAERLLRLTRAPGP